MKNLIKIMRFINSTFILGVLIFAISITKIGHTQTSIKSAVSQIGTYEFNIQKDRKVESKNVSGKTRWVSEINCHALIGKDEPNFNLKSISSHSVKALRAANSEFTGIKQLVQSNDKLQVEYLISKAANIDMTVDELIAKVIKALGGEKNLRKITSRTIKFELELVGQSLKGYGTTYQKAPNKYLSKIILKSSNKTIGSGFEYFDGKRGGFNSIQIPSYAYTGVPLEDLKFRVDLYSFLDLNEKIEKAEILRKEKFAGEDVYVLSIKPKKANKVTYFISSKTFLVLKKDRVHHMLTTPASSPTKIHVSEIYEDYRNVDGVFLPFKTQSKYNEDNEIKMADFTAYVKEIKHNVKIPNNKFREQSN